MKAKDWFSQFGLLRLRRQSAALRLVNLFSKTICSHSCIKQRRKARVVAAVLAVFSLGSAYTAYAQTSAIWTGAMSSDFNTAGNWSTDMVPTGVATFGASSRMTVTATGNAENVIQTLSFDAPGYMLNVSASRRLTLTGAGISGTSVPELNITTQNTALRFFNMSTAGPAVLNANTNGFIRFFNESTAGSAIITVANASNVEFHDSTTAGSATITSNSGGDITFNEMATGDDAKIFINSGGLMELGLTGGPSGFMGGTPTLANATVTINDGGAANFFKGSTGGMAQFIINAGGILDISGATGLTAGGTPGITAGSIKGDGTIYLGSRNLTVGTNNMDTVFSGLIRDGTSLSPTKLVNQAPDVASFTGGSLTKTGAGTLTLLGANTYSGGTTIEQG
jgi:autotransporter-associated beta strand protein